MPTGLESLLGVRTSLITLKEVRKFLRFCLVISFNFIATLLIFLVMEELTGQIALAYFTSFIFVTFSNMFLKQRYVFESSKNYKKLWIYLPYYSIYSACVYFILAFLVKELEIKPLLALICASLIFVPINFLASKYIFTKFKANYYPNSH